MLPLILVLLAQAPGPLRAPAGGGPIFADGSNGSFAFFEFAPMSGAGMGASCPMPNWLGYSEQLDNLTGWPNFIAGTGTNPTRVANVVASPAGPVTADQVDFPAVSAGANASAIRYVPAVALALVGTMSVWAKGVSGAGTVYLCDNGVPTCSPCAFTTASWTRCTASIVANSGAVYIAECASGWGGGCPVSTPATSVYLWGAMLEPTTAAAPSPYIATNTAPAGFTPTGAKGEALTFTRASTAYCTKGNTTSSIANGDLVLMPSGQARVMPGGDGTGGLGLLVESSRTNSMLRSQEIENAAWTKAATGGGSIPTVTADFGVAPDGTTTAERVQFSACATVGDSSTVSQVGSVQAGVGTFYIKGNGTSGSVRMVAYSAGGPGVDITSLCAFNSSTWTRCATNISAAAANILVVGCINQTATYGGASNTGTADVLLWGGQWEAGAFATSYIPTTTVAVARAAENGYFDIAGGPTGTASAAATAVAPVANMASAGVFHINAATPGDTSGTSSLWAYNQGAVGFIKCYYGGAGTGVVATTSTPSRVWCAAVAGSSLNGSYNGSGMVAGGAPGAAAALRYINIGGVAGFNWDGVIKQFCLDPSSTRCR